METNGCVHLRSVHVVLGQFGRLEGYYVVNAEFNRLCEENDGLFVVLGKSEEAGQVEGNVVLGSGEQNLSEHCC